MEHRLITGGEQYLPFARSRIRALRAIGNPYATERFTLPDATVAIRLVGEHEYIHITGGSTAIAMDSGVIDLVAIGAVQPARYANGVRKETGSTAAISAGFTLGASGAPWAQWFSKPGTVPNAQLLGTLQLPKFAGHFKTLAAAPSFEAARRPVTPATDPPTWEYTPDDEVLYAKKLAASGCPASIFTGRMRLYVQAMYGRPLYEYAGDASTSPADSTTARPTLGGDRGLPYLMLPPYRRTGDDEPYPEVRVNTSVGLRFDPATGKHWLLKISGTELLVYPLVSSKIGESLRAKLLNPAVGTGALTADDQDKLEAYILAWSLPDVKNAFTVAISGGDATSDYSMGYGWHWNWSGTAADIVTSSRFAQDASHEAMESIHRRISVAIDGSSVTASKSTVESLKRWAVDRAYWCIAEPEWAEMVTLKSTPRDSTKFVCDAPFYAFYNGDELQVCRIAVDSVTGAPQNRTMSVNFAPATFGATPDEFTAGLLDGYCQDEGVLDPYWKAKINCGSAEVSELFLGRITISNRWDLSGKTVSIAPTRDFSAETPYPAGPFDITYGYSAPYGTPITETLVGPGAYGQTNAATIQTNRETSILTRSYSSTLTCVVPFYDAEAIFLDTGKFYTEHKTGRVASVHTSTGLSSYHAWTPTAGSTTFYPTWLTGGPGGAVGGTTNPPDIVTTDTVSTTQLFCKAGAVAANMGELASFHDGEETATQRYLVWSGANKTSPVVLASGPAIGPVGLIGTQPLNPALVGWI